ncbi:MAG: polynucleotide kinase-phosphatase, partial [Bacteroidia bacterium]
ALRYPERELIDVKAKKVYAEPKRPLHVAPYQNAELSAQHILDDVLDFADFSGKKFLETRYHLNVSIRENNMTAALEVMSRFALNPKWLIYLPPTMSPCETSSLPDYLEYPTEAFSYFQKNGVEKVICEEKHMGSRAVVVICKSVEAAQKHFGVKESRFGVCYTRTGRNFFNDEKLENEFLQRVQSALTQSETWERFQTEWICLDCELMPWSAKAQELIRVQYAAVGASATNALAETLPFIRQTQARGIEIGEVLQEFEQKQTVIAQYVTAFRQYCKETNGLEGWKLAPFHILATEGKTHTDKDHVWQMETIANICKFDKDLLMATPYKVISLENEEEKAAAEKWWLDLTANGGEGMVVKPLNFISKKKDSLLQPAVKVRGREYLRIIYGAEYTISKNITRLKERAISAKRSLALREFVLGLEALERFAEKRPLRQIHECVMGILALETEGVDPRL